MSHRFSQIDVFTTEPFAGNPVAVVHGADDIDTATMQRIAHWTNLSETTFLLSPTDPAADYRVRIFTPTVELPFAGHPTLGSCHAWLAAGGVPHDGGEVVQQCGAGLVRVRHTEAGLAFAAPALLRSGPIDDDLRRRLATQLGIDEVRIVDAAWADNGPGWVAVLLADADEVLALRPGVVDLDIGVVGPVRHPDPTDGDPTDGDPTDGVAFEVRAFFPKDGATVEDPVTGSLNASLAQWLLATGRASAPYVASQGTALGRRGRVHVRVDDEGTIWVGGGTVTCVDGELEVGGAPTASRTGRQAGR